MLSIVILGTGNVAQNLFHALEASEQVKVVQIVGRNQNALKKYHDKVHVSTTFEHIKDADVYVIAVSDSAILEVSEKLPLQGLVVHTSGATPMNSLPQERKGVFYPLQTFTRGRLLDFAEIPICIEASDNDSLSKLKLLGKSISKKVYAINSEERKQLHVAAVFANNFSNHLFHISQTLCEKEGLSFELLKPLILETVNKLESLSPMDAQTGPARRNDSESMQKHLELLTQTEHKKLYTLLSEAISKTYEKEL